MIEHRQYAPGNTANPAFVTAMCATAQPDATDGQTRCACGPRCEDRSSFTDPNTGERITLAAPTYTAAALCATDQRHVRYALGSLPLDIIELSLLLQPSMEVKLRPVDMPAAPRVKLHAPVPINLNAEGLRALIGHETADMALAVAAALIPAARAAADAALHEACRRIHLVDLDLDLDADHEQVLADIQEAAAAVDTATATRAELSRLDRWHADAVARARVDEYVTAAARFLTEDLDTLLNLPEQPFPARSAGTDPATGHPDDTPVARHDDGHWWIWRDGTACALRLLDLHRQVEKFTGRTPADGVRVPCPECDTPAVVREHRNRQLVCRRCWTTWTDDQWDTSVAARLVGVFGLAA